MNKMNEVIKLEFVVAKQSQGFSKSYIFRNHLNPYIKENYKIFTLNRIPEIIMIDLAMVLVFNRHIQVLGDCFMMDWVLCFLVGGCGYFHRYLLLL
jgi:hypothetical protein